MGSGYKSIFENEVSGEKWKEVICIVFNYSISQTYKYVLGLANEEVIIIERNMYFREKKWVNDFTQTRIIGWKDLDKAGEEEIKDYIRKVEM